MAVYVGTRFRGVPGACSPRSPAWSSSRPPSCSASAPLYFRYRHLPALDAALRGAVAAAAAMTLAMGLKVGTPLLRDPGAIALAVAAFVGGARAPLAAPPGRRGAGTARRALGVAATAARRGARRERAARWCRLAILFGSLSLVSFGGGNTVVPAMHRDAVDGAALAHRPPVRRSLRARAGRARTELAHREPDRLRGRGHHGRRRRDRRHARARAAR